MGPLFGGLDDIFGQWGLFVAQLAVLGLSEGATNLLGSGGGIMGLLNVWSTCFGSEG
jgi:hypothetical protein